METEAPTTNQKQNKEEQVRKKVPKNVRRASTGAIQGGSFSKKYTLVQARVVFLRNAREQKRRPKIAFC
jgi:hypothetical protein